MTDTEVNVRIAEWCGYKRLKWVDRKGKKCSAWRSPDGKDLCPPPPSYTTDLNAIAEAEAKLSDEQWIRYEGELYRIQKRDGINLLCGRPKVIAATASQRAEALLKVI